MWPFDYSFMVVSRWVRSRARRNATARSGRGTCCI